MTIWFLLILALTQIAVGQEVCGQPKIIRTAPVVVPCLECLKNPSVNLASLLRRSPCGCGCGGMPYQEEDLGSSPSPVPLGSHVGTGSEDACYCCSADNNQGNNGGSSFGVSMLGPLASVLTTVMSGLGSSGNDEVTFDFDGLTCGNNPNEEYSPGGPQCDVLPYDTPTSNQTIVNTPYPPLGGPAMGTPYPPSAGPAMGTPYPPLAGPVGAPSPAVYNTQPLQRIPVAENKHTLGGCHCYRKSRKGVSDIEEDSLYAFAQNSPEEGYSCNSHINQETTFNRAFPHNRYSPDMNLNQQQVQMSRNDIHQPTGQIDNQHLFAPPPPTGNPEFDSISRLSAFFSSQKNNPYIQSSNHEQNIMPCDCCC